MDTRSFLPNILYRRTARIMRHTSLIWISQYLRHFRDKRSSLTCWLCEVLYSLYWPAGHQSGERRTLEKTAVHSCIPGLPAPACNSFSWQQQHVYSFARTSPRAKVVSYRRSKHSNDDLTFSLLTMHFIFHRLMSINVYYFCVLQFAVTNVIFMNDATTSTGLQWMLWWMKRLPTSLLTYLPRGVQKRHFEWHKVARNVDAYVQLIRINA